MRSSPTETIRKAPRWAGETVVVAASGPSLLPDDLTAIRGRWRLVVVNGTFMAAPWADVLYASDWRFWRAYRKRIEARFTGELWTVSKLAERNLGVQRLEVANTKGLDQRGRGVGGTNSGHHAVSLAALWGARRIILLGYDMQLTGGEHHWHGKHLGKLPNAEQFATWIEHMGVLARDAARAGIEVLNCSRATALRCFPRHSLEEVLGHGGSGAAAGENSPRPREGAGHRARDQGQGGKGGEEGQPVDGRAGHSRGMQGGLSNL